MPHGHVCQDSQISKPETPYFPKPPRPHLSLFFAILRELSRFFAIPRYEDHESHEPSRPTLFIHFVLLTSFLLSPSRLSGKRRVNKWMMMIGTLRQSQRRRDVTKTQGKNTRLLGSRLRDARRPQKRRSSRTTLLKSLRQAHECSLRSSDRVARIVAPFRAPARSSRSLTREPAPPRPGSTTYAVHSRL